MFPPSPETPQERNHVNNSFESTQKQKWLMNRKESATWRPRNDGLNPRGSGGWGWGLGVVEGRRNGTQRP